MRLGKCYALGDGAAYGARSTQHRHGVRIPFDDDFGSGLDTLQDGANISNQIGFRDVQHLRFHTLDHSGKPIRSAVRDLSPSEAARQKDQPLVLASSHEGEVCTGSSCLLRLLTRWIASFQDFLFLSARAFANIFRSPHYYDDVFLQMDIIGIGSLPIVIPTGLLSGAIIALQMSRALNTYGASSEVGTIVSLTQVRELGPMLTAIMVAGRNASGIASELGSMKVTEQIDAMRALGTDPLQKLVTPRLTATALMLPCLTVVADVIGLFGAYLIAVPLLHIIGGQSFWSTSWRALVLNDLAQGLIKPLLFGMIIALVGCYCGLRTSGGTQGVGRATTQAVVLASIWIFIATLLIDKIFVGL
ncbi:MAG: ABC transporter permease [Acidobacteriaceae bacterium]|nr:ABC transporter permease [Acidobacteriaceae bacterium]